MKTISEPSVPAPSSAASAAAARSERDRAEEEEPRRQHLADRERDGDEHPDERRSRIELSSGRAPQAGRAGRQAAAEHRDGGRRDRSAAPASRPLARPRCRPRSSRRPSRRRRRDVEQFEHAQEDRLVRLRLAVLARGEHRVDGEVVMLDEQIEVTRGVREQPDLEPAGAQRVERRGARRRRGRSSRRAPRPASSRRRSRTCRRPRPSPR